MRERFAFTLLDCPPSLGPVTVNALVAADRVIVPVQAEYLALEGLVQFLDTLAMIRRELNPALELSGVLITMHDERTRLAQDVERELREPLPRARLRHRDTPQRPGRRGAELRPAGDRPRPGLARLDAYRALPRRSRAWLDERQARNGPGPRGDPAREADAGRRRPARAAGRADQAQPEPAADPLRPRGPRRPRLLDRGQRRRPAAARPPLHGGSYELIAGERRWRAAQQAGLEKVPAVVRDSGEAERLQTALIENMVREDLNPVDEARACAALVEDLGLSKEELAAGSGAAAPRSRT